MLNTVSSIEKTIGNTPLVRLSKIEKTLGLRAELYAKLESFNPAGSAKDRAALYMMNDAEEKGILAAGGTIIEATSGNTGIALSMLAAVRGYRMIVVMPDSMSRERRDAMRAYGAELVLTDGALGMKGSIERAERLCSEIPGAVILGQFENEANARAHYETTAPEIECQLGGAPDYLVVGVGTGGTISGIGRYLKEKGFSTTVCAVEPDTSAVLSGGKAAPHGIQGIGAGFIPSLLDVSVIDLVRTVSLSESLEMMRLLGRAAGIFVGISSGAALAAMVKLAEEKQCIGKRIVGVFPDTGMRYLSLFGDAN